LITRPGIVNVDFADVRAIMQDSGSALMGIGIASGENRAVEAARAAINSPLLELSIDGAKGVLFNISGSTDVGMLEINEAANIITENIDPNAKVIFGAVVDEQIRKGDIQITVVATGFDSGKIKEMPIGLVNRAKSPTIGQLTREDKDSAPTQTATYTPSYRREEETEEVEEPNVFTSRRIEPTPLIIEEKIQPKSFSLRQESKDIVEEEDLEIPAFIRRKMKK
ncbi:MAG: cell division protein FtsZ, partial [Candidatus Moraniibacteriota bacterium]